MKLNNFKHEVDNILNDVKKPITYTGNEVNSVHKDLKEDTIRFALAFPDIYEVGMSHIGTKILYGLLNSDEDVWCERVFAPWVDMEEQMIEKGIPLYALESMDPIKNFDFVGFSLQYEMSYTNILNMLSLSHIALESKDRQEKDPFIIAGGPCTYNPEPLADFIDIFVIGESEKVIPKLVDLYKEWKKSDQSRESFLKEAAELEGIYVPRFYNVEYNGDGTIKSFSPSIPQAKPVIKKQYIDNLDDEYYPDKFVVPYQQTVHDRISYEIFRGCPHGCRFCQAGQIYKPVREKSLDRILNDIDVLLSNTGYEEISLASLSSGDYSKIEWLIRELMNRYDKYKIGVSLPSLRIDSLSIDMLKEMEKVKRSSITLAPEAGTQRLRDVINKNVTEEDLMNTVSLAFNEGWNKVKLYFMTGLPTETDKDIEGIADLANKVVEEYYKVPKNKRKRGVQVTVSTSCFVPKPFTAFQWVGQVPTEEFNRKQRHLKQSIKNKRVRYNWHESNLSYLEAVFARGDRRLGKVLKRAWELGCRFDSWNEQFDYSKWEEAFVDTNINPDFYASRQRDFSEILPWDFIDIGVSKDYLRLEWEKSLIGKTSTNCKIGCEHCGMMGFIQEKNINSNLCFNKDLKSYGQSTDKI